MQSAVGRAQLRKLSDWVEKRRKLADVLSEEFAQIPGLRVPHPPDEVGHSFYKYYAFVDPQALQSSWNRDRIMQSISAKGIPCFSGSCSEIYLEKAFSDDMRPQGRLRIAKELGDTSLMFLVHPTLDEDHMFETTKAVRDVMATATR
jgi:dTDP-4-amino-4,6-dideoxygalactose transaminase